MPKLWWFKGIIPTDKINGINAKITNFINDWNIICDLKDQGWTP